jgi:hypothetical protein
MGSLLMERLLIRSLWLKRLEEAQRLNGQFLYVVVIM